MEKVQSKHEFGRATGQVIRTPMFFSVGEVLWGVNRLMAAQLPRSARLAKGRILLRPKKALFSRTNRQEPLKS
jgi:hypothetical protein